MTKPSTYKSNLRGADSHQTRVAAGKKAAKTRGHASLAEAGQNGGKAKGKRG